MVKSALAREIQQTKDFDSPAIEAAASLIRTSELLTRQLSRILRAYGLTPAQHNVLMILRGAGPDGLNWSQVGERMLSRDPDITRMLDKLQESGLVLRAKSPCDRRVVVTRIAAAGIKLLADLEPCLDEMFRTTLGAVPPDHLQQLNDLLAEVRIHLA